MKAHPAAERDSVISSPGLGMNEDITIQPGNYQIPESLRAALTAKLGEIIRRSGGATTFGVGYYEEHSGWAWINLLVANGNYFDKEKLVPSFLYFAVRDAGAWRVVLSENDQEYLSLLDTVSRAGLSSDEIQLLNEYYALNKARSDISALSIGGLLAPWPSSQNSWRFSSYGFHAAGFQSLGVEQGAEAIDLLPPVSAQPAKILAMETGTVVNKLECTWNTVLIVRHDGYPDPKRFLYLHIQNGTSPVGIGATLSTRGQYLGDLRTPVFNGYWSNGTCSSQGSGAFNCERDVNPATQNLCSASTARHLHLGLGTDRNIIIDGNTVANLVPGNNYNSTNQESAGISFIDTVGVFRPSNGVIFLKNTHTSGFADIALNYGLGGDYPVVGDWDGDGHGTIGVYRGNTFLLRNSNTIGFADISFIFGEPGDQPIAGDWDGDGDDTIGVYRPSIGLFLLRNSNSAGPADISFYLGNVGDVGIAGDWDGDDLDTTGVFRPSNGIIFLKNENDTGFADTALNYGIPGDKPVVGDWDNDGDITIGVYRNGRFYLRNSNTIGFADIIFDLGNPGDMPIAGNWDGLP